MVRGATPGMGGPQGGLDRKSIRGILDRQVRRTIGIRENLMPVLATFCMYDKDDRAQLMDQILEINEILRGLLENMRDNN